MSRDKYFLFLKQNELQDYFKDHDDISYSYKLKLIKSWCSIYSISIIKKALNEYYNDWIRKNRFQPVYLINNTVKYLCKKFSQEENEKMRK